MRSRAHWTIGLIFILAFGLVRFSIASAQGSKPIITTPTPTVTALPAGAPLTADRVRVATLLPLVVGGHQVTDVTPDSFTYAVQPGDTLWALALDFGRDLDTMSCTTDPRSPDAETLVPNQTITVPALSDLCYTVTPDDTLASIAAHHNLSVEKIVAVTWNGFTSAPYTVVPRQRVLLPGARRASVPRADRNTVSLPADTWAKSPWPTWPYGDGHFVWPVFGPISQGFRPGHYAIDIAIPAGTPVKAADRGTVVMAGWNTSGYGFRVVIDHGNDYLTLYAHLSDIYVETGEVVGKGQVIGASGANGNITGPHLHFEIRDFGVLTDPLKLLSAEITTP